MKSAAPHISVILPVHNGAKLLEEAVSSLRRQAPAPFEVVLVDDGSTDDTPAVAASLGTLVRYIRQEQQGPAAARNAGIHASRGEFLAFIDADDLWTDRHVAVLLAPFAKDSTLQLVVGQVQQFLLHRSADGREEFRPWKEPRFCFHLGAALFRRSAFAKIGDFNRDLLTSDDLDWFLRAREEGLPMRVVPETVYRYRLHSTNLTRDAGGAEFLIATAIKMSLERRRNRHGDCSSLTEIAGMPRPGRV